MSGFNSQATIENIVLNHSNIRRNHAGSVAFGSDPKTDLYLTVCSAFLEDKFYEKSTDAIKRILSLCKDVETKYILSLANYSRNMMNLRSVSTLLLVCAATKNDGHGSIIRKYVSKIVNRADELTEVVSCYIKLFGNKKKKNFPNALKRGLADAFGKFDSYQLQKYNRNNMVKLRDVLRLVHPKPITDEDSLRYKNLKEGSLPTPNTWETYISEEGSNAKSWNEVAPKMGVMALVRNLRNFERVGATDALSLAIETITNEEKVRSSKLLPFRWLSAEREVKSQKLKDALRIAVNHSISNLPKMKGRTAIFCDLSGSMANKRISSNSKICPIDIACLMGAMSNSLSEESFVGVFGTNFMPVSISALDSVITNTDRIRSMNVGSNTYAHKAFSYILSNSMVFDRIVILSDMQCYGSVLAEIFHKYKSSVNTDVRLYSVDLCGYGTVQFLPEDKNVVLLSGWSERILDYISSADNIGSVASYIESEF